MIDTAHLSSFAIGLKRKSVDVQPYNPEWKKAFAYVKAELDSILPKECQYQIEHIGSTSIPSLSAKPILDVLLIVNDPSDFEKFIPLLERAGFAYKGDGVSLVQQTDPDPKRHSFSFYNDEETIDFIHLHMTDKNHSHSNDLIQFRDCLCANPKLAEEYQALKIQLWKNGIVRREYTRAKSAFIAKVLI